MAAFTTSSVGDIGRLTRSTSCAEFSVLSIHATGARGSVSLPPKALFAVALQQLHVLEREVSSKVRIANCIVLIVGIGSLSCKPSDVREQFVGSSRPSIEQTLVYPVRHQDAAVLPNDSIVSFHVNPGMRMGCKSCVDSLQCTCDWKRSLVGLSLMGSNRHVHEPRYV